jgi:hypothetical protein
MLKEIYEQPAVIGDTLNSFINPATGHIAVARMICWQCCPPRRA